MEIEAGVQERYRDSSLRGTDLTHFFLLDFIGVKV